MAEYNGAVSSSIRQVARGTLRELFPTTLESLGAATPTVSPGPYCPRCGGTIGSGECTAGGCASCFQRPLAWDRLVRLGPYVDPLAKQIRSLKFRRDWQIAGVLGRALARRLETDAAPVRRAVCPVPMFWVRRWVRGFNQAALIGEALARARRWPVFELLRRTRHRPSQTSVSATQRAANIRDSFAVAQVDLSGYEIILVDDVKTTGATLSVCTRLLKGAGAARVTVAVAAVADRQRSQTLGTREEWKNGSL